ncbi:MAG: hypothetical protein ACO36I_00805 [Candidatus Latescibacterota bacterium]
MYLMLLLALLATNAQSDTLKLIDGTELTGTYIGGTRLRIQFEVQDKIQHIPISNIMGLSFENKETIPSPTPPEQPVVKHPTSPQFPTQITLKTSPSGLTLPVQTALNVNLAQMLHTADQKRGNRFTVTLKDDIRQNRRVILPQNTKIYGRITRIQSIKLGTSQIAMELSTVNINNHLYTLTTNRIELICDGDLITVIAGESAFDSQTELGDFITHSGEMLIPAQTPLRFHLVTPLRIRNP